MKRPAHNIINHRGRPAPPGRPANGKPVPAKHLAPLALPVLSALALLTTALCYLACTTPLYTTDLIGLAVAWLTSLALAAGTAQHIARRRHQCRIDLLADNVAHASNARGQTTIPKLDNPLYDKLIAQCNTLLERYRKTNQQLEKQYARVESKVMDRTRSLRLALRRLERTARTDPLSGLANRGHFDARLASLFDECLTQPGDLVCMMIDMDNFKAVNDTFGHCVGDAVISFLGELLAASVRDEDVAARLGGDEFVLVLPDTDARAAHWIAERTRRMFAREVASLLPELYEDSQSCDKSGIRLALRENEAPKMPRQPRLSIGIATVKGNKARTPRELLDMADRALYQAKRSGRNVVATLKPAEETEEAVLGATT